MKLELKHLSAYLPYSVRFLMKHKKKEYWDSKPSLLHERTFSWALFNNKLRQSKVELVLRPLSDLTKEIELNGEKFIPIDKIKAELLGVDWMVFGESEYGWNGFIDKSMSSQVNHIPIFMGNEIMGECNYFIYQKLCEWHFDIFGLIDAGLAVDINTVKF